MTENTMHFSASLTETKERTFTGTAVPFGEFTRDDRALAFSAEAFGDITDLALAAVMINHPFNKGEKAVRVGRVTEWTADENGLHFAARLNDTPAADTVYAGMKDGSITGVSVGVYVSDFADESSTVLSAEVLELSLITEGIPAFQGALISEVFSESATEEKTSSEQTSNQKAPIMDNTYVEVAEFEARIDDVNREIARLNSDSAPSVNTESRFKTFGSIAKAIAEGDEDAKAEYLAYEGGTVSDTTVRPAWVADVRKFVEGKRPLTEFFNRAALPATGMTVNYLIDGTDTIDVAEQVNEGDDLVGPGKLTLDQASAPIKTYGGWVEWSLQQIERSDVNVVEEGFRRLARRYAQVTEGVTRARFVAAGSAHTGFDVADYADIVGAVADSAKAFGDKGMTLDGLIVSVEVFKSLATLDHDGSFILDRQNGNVSVPGLNGNVFGISLVVDPSLTGNVFAAASREAITTWEQGPNRLQDGNVINLTSQFSLYGLMAQATTDVAGIRRYTV